jgi:hypothetical protein
LVSSVRELSTWPRPVFSRSELDMLRRMSERAAGRRQEKMKAQYRDIKDR